MSLRPVLEPDQGLLEVEYDQLQVQALPASRLPHLKRLPVHTQRAVQGHLIRAVVVMDPPMTRHAARKSIGQIVPGAPELNTNHVVRVRR